MSTRILLLACFLLHCLIYSLPASGQASQPGAAEGTLIDSNTREALPGVNLQVLDSTIGASTDEEGYFLISGLTPGVYTIKISMIGYGAKTLRNVDVRSGETTSLGTIALIEESISLKEITVTPGRFSIMGGQDVSRQTLTNEQIKNMTWADDVTRAVARLPGISSTDFSSKFTIRGGESDEVLMTLDGMELYEPFHQRDFAGGLFSIVNIETLDGIDLVTGGFSAEYGNRLSGVFSMKTRQVEPGQSKTSVGLSLTTARFYTDGTFAQGKGSYLLSFRRGMLDVLFNVASVFEEATIDQGALPEFYDAMGKLEYRLSPKQRLTFHVLQAGDKNAIEDVEGDNFDRNSTKYNNTYGWLTLHSAYSPFLYASTYLYSGYISHDRAGSFNKYEPSDKGFFNLTDKRDYVLLGIKQDWNWEVSDGLILSGGVDVRQLDADYRYASQLEELRVDQNEEIYDFALQREIDTKPSGQQMNVYLSNRVKVLPKVALEAGIRYDRSTYSNDDVWSPRLGVAYAISDKTILRSAWGYYYQSQFINNLDVNHGSITFNPAELAKHYVVGVQHAFPGNIELRLEGYYKDMSNYVPSWLNLRDSQEVFPEARNDNARVLLDGATAKGIELF